MDNKPASPLAPAHAATLDAVIARLRPDAAPAIRSRIEEALAARFGPDADPGDVQRFLDDIRVAQSMSGIDIDYAEHYTHMHKAGVDFMRLIQIVKAADKDYK